MITATRKHEKKKPHSSISRQKVESGKKNLCAPRPVRMKWCTRERRNRWLPESRPNFQPNAERTKKQPQEFATSRTPKCRFLKLPWHKLFHDFFFCFLASLLTERRRSNATTVVYDKKTKILSLRLYERHLDPSSSGWGYRFRIISIERDKGREI